MARRRKGTGMAAGFGGHPPALAARDVPNPYSPDGAAETVVVNVREHPLEWMFHRGRIDAAQKRAGDRLRLDFEIMGAAGGGSIDYTAIRVDGGGKGDVFSERRLRAGRELAEVSRIAGQLGYRVLQRICGDGMTLEALAGEWPAAGSRQTVCQALGLILRETLTDLAVHWGYAVRRPARK